MKPLPAAALPAAAALLLCACTGKPAGTVIARVGDASLTLEAARAELDTAAPDYRQRLGQYVTSWVNAELLHQEALRLGIDRDPAFESRVASVRRQLANQEVLDRLVYADTAAPGDSLLLDYFDAHRDEFTLPEPYRKLRLGTFRSRETARRFVVLLGGGRTWQNVLDSMTADPRASAEIVRSGPEEWYTASTIYPPELWKVAGPLMPGEVSFPLKTDDGYTVLQFIALAPAGKAGDFEIVRNDVADRVVIERRRAGLERLLGTLRERYGVEISMETAPSANGDTPPHE